MFNGCIQNVTSKREVCNGFIQTFFCNLGVEILFNSIKKGVGLQRHSHREAQFVYCYGGKFELAVGDKTHIVKSGESLNMEPYEAHGVEVIDDILTVDIKYNYKGLIKKQEQSIHFDVLCGTKGYCTSNIKIIELENELNANELSYSFEPWEYNYLISPSSYSIYFDNCHSYLEPLNIYKLDVFNKKSCSLSIDSKVTKKPLLLHIMS